MFLFFVFCDSLGQVLLPLYSSGLQTASPERPEAPLFFARDPIALKTREALTWPLD
jgi:hypothetical protein